MEFIIAAMVILIVGLVVSLIWGGGLKKELGAANRRSRELADERDDANRRSTQLEGERNEVIQHSAQLESERNDANRRSTQFQSERDDAHRRSAQLQSDLNTVTQRNAQLQNDLNTARQQNSELQSERDQIAQSNDNAIRLLYLTTLSLQACGIALRRELDRSKRLGENYRNLANAYNQLVGHYEDFREDIKSKARQRLVRKGIGVALAFIPGLALIDILGDLGEILDVVNEADAAIEVLDVDVDSIDKSVESSSEAPEISDTGMPIEGVSFLPLIPRAQNGVEETLQQNISMERTTRDPSDLDAFVADILQYMKALVNSLTDDEHRKAIAEMINNLQEMDYKLRYPGRTDKNRLQRKRK